MWSFTPFFQTKLCECYTQNTSVPIPRRLALKLTQKANGNGATKIAGWWATNRERETRQEWENTIFQILRHHHIITHPSLAHSLTQHTSHMLTHRGTSHTILGVWNGCIWPFTLLREESAIFFTSFFHHILRTEIHAQNTRETIPHRLAINTIRNRDGNRLKTPQIWNQENQRRSRTGSNTRRMVARRSRRETESYCHLA